MAGRPRLPPLRRGGSHPSAFGQDASRRAEEAWPHGRERFTVTVGTAFERGHVPLTTWLQAAYLLCRSKKGISSHRLHRTLGVTHKTAWFTSHRLREAMRDGAFDVFGSGGGEVEADETFIGNDRAIKPHGAKKGRGHAHEHKVLALADRASGRAKAWAYASESQSIAAEQAPFMQSLSSWQAPKQALKNGSQAVSSAQDGALGSHSCIHISLTQIDPSGQPPVHESVHCLVPLAAGRNACAQRSLLHSESSSQSSPISFEPQAVERRTARPRSERSRLMRPELSRSWRL